MILVRVIRPDIPLKGLALRQDQLSYLAMSLKTAANIKLNFFFVNIQLLKNILSVLIFLSFINIYIAHNKYQIVMSDKIKFEIEFVIQSSPQLLYQYLSTPSGLSEWFADNVNSRGEMFTFIWDGSEEEAKLLKRKSDEFVKFTWEENDDDSFFEMKIIVDEITKDVSLFITDFAEEDEVDEAKMLWENQVSSLKQVLGSK